MLVVVTPVGFTSDSSTAFSCMAVLSSSRESAYNFYPEEEGSRAQYAFSGEAKVPAPSLQ